MNYYIIDQSLDVDCLRMSDPEKTVNTSGSINASITCNVQKHPSPQELNDTNAKLHDFLDLTDFVNQRIEEDLDELFVSRYTMANELYAEVANGFPDPVTVYPWSKRPKRNFDYTGDHRKPWRGDSRRNVSSEWRSNRGNPSYDPYVQELRKRRNPTMDIIKKQHTTNP
ncbi:2-succinyl-5-enolpyruvyl-6-hydroxy-3-cyclohexene-1-carboxylate synthase [Dirofilaria immitis]